MCFVAAMCAPGAGAQSRPDPSLQPQPPVEARDRPFDQAALKRAVAGTHATPATTSPADVVAHVAAGVGEVVVGAFLGAMTGYYVDRYALGGDHCACDDPGFRGFLFGGLIGAIGFPIALHYLVGWP
jgi:hypothetical protein